MDNSWQENSWKEIGIDNSLQVFFMEKINCISNHKLLVVSEVDMGFTVLFLQEPLSASMKVCYTSTSLLTDTDNNN